MNIVLWILQMLLAAEFVFHGWIFLFPPAELVDIMTAVLFVLCAFVAYMRWKVKPLTMRQTAREGVF